MPSTEQTALEEFLLDIECLNDLSPWIDDINIFEILKMSKMEIRHSNFLSWLLSPNESHSFGDRIIKDIICHLIKHNRNNIDKAFNIIDATTLWNYESFNVYREKDNIDILIVSDTEKLLMCIENKVFSQEHTEQTTRYRHKIDETYPEYKKIFVFLTPDGDEAIDYENWVTLSYRELIGIIEKNISAKNLNINAKEKIFIENYISGVKIHIMEDMNLQEICSKIYYKHRKALDLIFENKPNMRDTLRSALVEKLENEVNSTGNIDFDKNDSSKTYIRFNTSYSRKLFPKLIEPRKSDWHTDFVFCYEINIRYNLLYAVINNSNLLENELEMVEKIRTVVGDKKPLKDNWQWKGLNIAKRNKIIKTNPDEMSHEELNGEKDNIVKDIFDNVMKAVEKFEDKLKESEL